MNTPHTSIQDTYEALLLSYAAGLLDQAQSLIVASHIALSPEAREKVHSCEALGGALMEKYCEPVKMKKQSLANVLAKLDAIENPIEREEMYEIIFPEGLTVPLVLRRSIACRVGHAHWHQIRPGVQSLELHLECPQSKTRFLKAEKGTQAPRFARRAMELTLILDGALYDETGQHKRGDLVIADETCKGAATSCKQRGGFFMVVSSAPIHVGGLQRLLDFLMRH